MSKIMMAEPTYFIISAGKKVSGFTFYDYATELHVNDVIKCCTHDFDLDRWALTKFIHCTCTTQRSSGTDDRKSISIIRHN